MDGVPTRRLKSAEQRGIITSSMLLFIQLRMLLGLAADRADLWLKCSLSHVFFYRAATMPVSSQHYLLPGAISLHQVHDKIHILVPYAIFYIIVTFNII